MATQPLEQNGKRFDIIPSARNAWDMGYVGVASLGRA